MLSVADASARILAAMSPLSAELVALDEAWSRVLAEDAIARRNLPPHDNSAMDGFAVRAADIPGTLSVAGTIAAGDVPQEGPNRADRVASADKSAPDAGGDGLAEAGIAWRIMTGAPMPPGADAVVIREEADDRGHEVAIEQGAAVGAHVRYAGEDIAIGEVAVPAGTLLRAGEIALLAALGNAAVRVRRRPVVAILSTGDELVGVDVPPRPGQIVNSNANGLAAQIREAGGRPVNVGIAPDQLESLSAMLRGGMTADVLLTSGGVSVGDFDYVKEAFRRVGVSMDFWKVAMKPGKPLAFGVSDSGLPVFGLPGNPVSSMTAFELFVRPALLTLQGCAQVKRPRVHVVIGSDYNKRPGRAHFLRARLERRQDTLVAHIHPKQGSAMLSSMVGVDALVEVARDAGSVSAGTQLPALLLSAV